MKKLIPVMGALMLFGAVSSASAQSLSDVGDRFAPCQQLSGGESVQCYLDTWSDVLSDYFKY
ncbi:hypothetical protein [Xanthomonas bundabergensis]|uniref:hypothetical protein n=1 Tax=Xanthomonas bundabergensis TaxID=3160842 RepID=UPI0035123C82